MRLDARLVVSAGAARSTLRVGGGSFRSASVTPAEIQRVTRCQRIETVKFELVSASCTRNSRLKRPGRGPAEGLWSCRKLDVVRDVVTIDGARHLRRRRGALIQAFEPPSDPRVAIWRFHLRRSD